MILVINCAELETFHVEIAPLKCLVRSLCVRCCCHRFASVGATYPTYWCVQNARSGEIGIGRWVQIGYPKWPRNCNSSDEKT